MASSTAVSASPSRRRVTLWGITVAFCLIALFTSGYLSWTTMTNTNVVCIEADLFDCAKVEGSIYSRFMGIPVAYLGFASYAAIFVLLLLEKRYSFFREYGVLLILGISLFGFLYHTYLTYVSVAFLGSLCPWCVATNISMGAILVATVARVLRRYVFVGE